MKLHVLLGTTLASLASHAWAQSAEGGITLYGIADAGVEYARTGPNARALRVESGLLSSSRFGVRGSEPLGGGLRAVFTLEAGVDLDIGAASEGFSRQAFAGLQGGFGTLTLGRHQTPQYQVLSEQTVFGQGLAGSARNHAVDHTRRVSNSLVYESPKVAGVRGTLMLGAGNESSGAAGSAPLAAGRYAGASLEAERGPLSAALAYGYRKATAVTPGASGLGAAAIELLGGITYKIGAVSVNAGAYRRRAAADFSGRSVWLGTKIKAGRGDVLAQVARIDGTDARNRDATLWALGYVHPLSRRTSLYASLGVMANGAAANYGITGSGNDPPDTAVRARGYNGRSLMLGMRHTV